MRCGRLLHRQTVTHYYYVAFEVTISRNKNKRVVLLLDKGYIVTRLKESIQAFILSRTFDGECHQRAVFFPSPLLRGTASQPASSPTQESSDGGRECLSCFLATETVCLWRRYDLVFWMVNDCKPQTCYKGLD
jgi:hypothetical protein